MSKSVVAASEPSFSILIPVGPGERELIGLRDVLTSVQAHAGEHKPHVVLIDDAPTPRPLEECWPGAEVVRTPVWCRGTPDPLTAMVTGTIIGLNSARGLFALKLDTDAFVIAPFVEQIAGTFAVDTSLGVIGAYDRSPDGGRRDWSIWRGLIRRSTWPIRLQTRASGERRSLRYRPRTERAYARAVISAAVRNPNYQLGAHCLGGAYAVSASLLKRARSWDWRPWVQAGLGEDVVLGLLCAAAGLRMQGMVGPGEPFGVTWSGLPGPPAELVDRGYSIVHSVKSGAHGTEHELRAWFRAHTVARRPDR